MYSLSHSLRLPLLLASVCCMIQGCTIFMPETTARVKGAIHATPVVEALEKFHKDEGTYPRSLDELARHDQGLAKSLPDMLYKRLGKDDYDLWFEDGASDVHYVNGKRISAQSYPFR